MEPQAVTVNEELGILAVGWVLSLLGNANLERSYLLNSFRELSDFEKAAVVGAHHVMLNQGKYD